MRRRLPGGRSGSDGKQKRGRRVGIGPSTLVAQADPALTPAQMTQVLDRSAAPALGGALATGAGLLDASAAVQMALSLAHGAA